MPGWWKLLLKEYRMVFWINHMNTQLHYEIIRQHVQQCKTYLKTEKSIANYNEPRYSERLPKAIRRQNSGDDSKISEDFRRFPNGNEHFGNTLRNSEG